MRFPSGSISNPIRTTVPYVIPSSSYVLCLLRPVCRRKCGEKVIHPALNLTGGLRLFVLVYVVEKLRAFRQCWCWKRWRTCFPCSYLRLEWRFSFRRITHCVTLVSRRTFLYFHTNFVLFPERLKTKNFKFLKTYNKLEKTNRNNYVIFPYKM